MTTYENSMRAVLSLSHLSFPWVNKYHDSSTDQDQILQFLNAEHGGSPGLGHENVKSLKKI